MLTLNQAEKIRKALPEDAAALMRMFDALSDPSRFRIFLVLREHKGLCVTDIANVLGISVPAASQQFRILESAGVVTRERSGQRTCYRIAEDQNVKAVTRLLAAKKK
jgi:ArsR family transcriptional regulator